MRARLRRAARSPLPALTALYAVAAAVATLPALSRFGSAFISTGLPGYGEAASGDHLQTVYRFWLVGHQLERADVPWRDPYSFQPLVEPQVVLGGWPFGFAFWPLDALLGPVVAWNVLLLAGIVAAGLLAYLWLAALGLPRPASALGGLAFAVAPYRIVQSGGHLLGWAAIFFPLSLWAFERSRMAVSGRSAHGWGVLAAGGLVSIPLSGQLHLALGAIPFLLAYAAVRFRPVPALWTVAGALGGVAIGLVANAALIADSSARGGRSLSEVAAYSAGWLDLVSRWRLDGLERFVYVGWLTPVLAAAGLVLLARRRPWLAALLGVAAVAPLLLALGTNLPSYSVLRDALPPLRYPRVPGRFLPIANLALAALVAFAAAHALARLGGARRLAAVALLALLLAGDLLVFPLRPSAADPGNAAYGELAAAGAGRILELPVFARGTGHYGSVYHYYALQAPRERPTGYSLAPRSTFAFTWRFNRLDCGAWLPGDREELRRLGIRYLLFHRGLYEQGAVPGAWFAWRGLEQAGYRPLQQGGAVWLFGEGSASAGPPPVPEPDRSEPVFCDGWRRDRIEHGEAAVWVWGAGRLALEVETAPNARTVLFADGVQAARRTGGPTRIEADLAGEGWHALVVRVAAPARLTALTLLPSED